MQKEMDAKVKEELEIKEFGRSLAFTSLSGGLALSPGRSLSGSDATRRQELKPGKN